MLSFAVPTFTKPEALPMSNWMSKLKPYKTPPCPTDRFTTDCKDPVYSCFFLLLGEEFTGNSSNIHWEFIALCFNETQGREGAEVVSLDEAVHHQISPWHWSCSSYCGDTLRGRTYLRETILRISGAV
jgi:hypothetical protein